jgi:predicted permease
MSIVYQKSFKSQPEGGFAKKAETRSCNNVLIIFCTYILCNKRCVRQRSYTQSLSNSVQGLAKTILNESENGRPTLYSGLLDIWTLSNTNGYLNSLTLWIFFPCYIFYHVTHKNVSETG